MPGNSDSGHVLAAGAGVVVQVTTAKGFWFWPPTGEGEITISDGAPTPVREA